MHPRLCFPQNFFADNRPNQQPLPPEHPSLDAYLLHRVGLVCASKVTRQRSSPGVSSGKHYVPAFDATY